MGRAEILVAEDNEINLFVLMAMLRADGHEPLVALDGVEAVEMALRDRPRVILMDVGMPRLDGLSAAREIRRHLPPSECRIVAVTAHVTERQRQDCRWAGFDAFIGKPFDFKVLRGVLERALSGELLDGEEHTSPSASDLLSRLRPPCASRAG